MYWRQPALLLASCSNDDTVQVASGKGIRFRMAVDMNTRALSADLAGLKATRLQRVGVRHGRQ